MPPEVALPLLIVSLPFLAVGGVTAGVATTTWYAVFRGRRDPMDPFQERAFLARRASLSRRTWGLALEGFWQTVAFSLQAVHWVRRFRSAPLVRGGGRPVLLVAGYLENSGQMWPLARQLQARGFQPVLLDLPSTLKSIGDNTAFLRGEIERAREESGWRRVGLVGHSMGGVIMRACALADEDDPAIATVVSVCSPHRGTHLARLGPGQSARDMRPGSDHMRSHPPTRVGKVPVHTMISVQDNIVSPAWSTVLCAGENVVLQAPVGHVAPLFLGEAVSQVVAWLDAADYGPAPHAAPQEVEAASGERS